MFARERSQLLTSRRRAGFEHHERVWRLAPLLVRHAHNRNFLHGVMAEEDAFDFDG